MSKSGYDSSSIPSKESNSSRNSFYHGMGLLFFKLLKTRKLVIRKKATVMTGLDNPEEDPYASPSTEINWDNISPNALYSATEVGTAQLDPFRRVPNPSGGRAGSGWGRGSQRPHGNNSDGRANNTPSQNTPRPRTNAPPTPASQSAQGRHHVAPSSYHDPNFPSAGGSAVFRENVHDTREVQVIGVDIGPDMHGPDDMRQTTANFDAQQCLHSGTGSQIIGQRVRQGGQPRPFAGYFAHNRNLNGGEQIIGIQLG
ncbi:hypothetical protein EKO27_g5677 [Xylaria grammica]|uniref:Uncharacterized protein n=1 Tax=Xylaria grammica TaxID=363999 RepID=A0A439D4W8_9PEZI|nr:hypothetical protein EKO27_g5677 [Xylaria grammica]